MMYLELLPNEILLDLFDYFDGTNLLRAFYGLNSRVNCLLYEQFRSYHFQFNCVSKRHFDLICQQHLPFILDQVIALQLSDDNETPGQINLFVSYIPSLRQFTHLRLLTLSNLHSYDILIKFLNECQDLCYLTHLKYSCPFTYSRIDFQRIVNKIWSLPKLTNCSLVIDKNQQKNFWMPTIISSSLKYVSISGIKLRWNQINGFFQHTPHLKHLSAIVRHSVFDGYIQSPLPTLIKLNLRCHDAYTLSKINVVFQNVPNLNHLDLTVICQLIGGHTWEQIIRNHLPKLKTFRLNMIKRVRSNENIEEQLINSFQSPFWIKEHQWFLRCFTWRKIVHFYTLSSADNYHGSILPVSWQFRNSHNEHQKFYANAAGIYSGIFYDERVSADVRLFNIDFLQINFPVNDQFWSIVSNLNRLKMLTVSSYTDTFQSQLQTLLDQAPHLHTIRINHYGSLPLQMSLFNHTNTSVRQIDLYNYNLCFNEEECLIFSRSSLGVQCEVLSVRVQNRESIIHLIENMLNLRSLRVYLKLADNYDDFRNKRTETSDELVQWLKDQLPSAYLKVEDSQYGCAILFIIWI